MKTIGLIGGMSWESTVTYYQLINQGIKANLGGLHSARLILNSVDFAVIEDAQHNDQWRELADMLVVEAQKVERAGAECLLICTNTMHKVADDVEAAINIPLIHIADATAIVLQHRGIKTVGLLGTKFTMEQEFYSGRLEHKYGIKVLTPDFPSREKVHRVIYQELCQGIIKESSATEYLKIITQLAEQGAEAVILGCTEIGLLVKQSQTKIPLIDTTMIHAKAAVDWSVDQ